MIGAHITLVPDETDRSGNIRSSWIFVTIPGDVDGDANVDIFDIVIAAGHYGQNW